MLEYDRVGVNKINVLQKCIIFPYWHFLEINFRFQPKVCDGCLNENHNHYYYKVFLEKCSCK